MAKKLELVLYQIEIEKYISELTNDSGEPAGNEERRKTRIALANFMKLLKDNGRTWPEISDFDTFTANSKANPHETTANDRRIRKFFASIDTGRKNVIMTDNSTAQPLDGGTSSEITANIEPEETTENQPETWPEETATPAPVRKKPGRKVFDTVNGEKKSEKIMLYLTPALIEKVRAWCDMKGVSYLGFITGLIEDFLKDREDKINAFLEMRKEL